MTQSLRAATEHGNKWLNHRPQAQKYIEKWANKRERGNGGESERGREKERDACRQVSRVVHKK